MGFELGFGFLPIGEFMKIKQKVRGMELDPGACNVEQDNPQGTRDDGDETMDQNEGGKYDNCTRDQKSI